MLVSLVTFGLAATLVVLLPGPDTLVVVRNLVRGGRSIAARTVLGVLSGLTVWVITAVLGLSAVLRASHDAYVGLRIVGAAYLIYLGIKSLRAREDKELSSRRLLGTGYTAGLLTDLLNPKVGVFFVTVLPASCHTVTPCRGCLSY
jgi:threonine/homoserine/homoserine lactone efflux protein